MKTPPSSTPADPVSEAAAAWAVRHDRGLTAAEQDEFSSWLAESPTHRTAWAEARWGWDELDRLAGLQTSMHAVADPDLLAPPRRRRWATVYQLATSPWAVAAGLVLALGLFFAFRGLEAPKVQAAPQQLALIEQRTLSDGSTVELNRGAIIREEFEAGVRRVRLLQGEAHFHVVHDTSRPFIVETRGVAVRAVGTAFNVRLEAAAVEVLVTEGRVSVNDASDGTSLLETLPDGAPQVLSAGQGARVDLASTAAPQIIAVSAPQMEDQLAWKPRLLDFTNAPMPEIVAAFNRGNPVRLTLDDAALADMRLSATFRSDNIEGFVRLMKSDFGLSAEWRGNDEIVLRRAQ